MPEGKSISFSAGEYPELEGLESGAKIKFSGEAIIEMDKSGGGSIMIESMELETEGPATRELKRMTKQEDSVVVSGQESDGDDF